ncbi:hypothetical protein NST28_29280 [Paenibacillus sp. FSL R10-2791]|uniref:hypothetical protein n=1 Tax=Paenibacillus sp. FSL R10-2791 TaxID=2954695 RepID=UPI0030F5A253
MLGKSKELRSELMDARELDGWLVNSDVIVIDIKFCMADTSHNGLMPQALVIYKEEA